MSPPEDSPVSIYSDRMRRVRQHSTAPELGIARELTSRGMEFQSDVSPFEGERSRPDFVIPRHQLALYVDGCFWHGCPEHFTLPRTQSDWWASKVSSNRQRDAAAFLRLTAAGWKVVRVWAHEDPADVVASVLRAISAT